MPKYRDDSHGRLVISGKELEKVLRKKGYWIDRVRGDHLIMKDAEGHLTQVEIGGKSRDLGQNELSTILDQTELTKSDIHVLRKRV